MAFESLDELRAALGRVHDNLERNVGMAIGMAGTEAERRAKSTNLFRDRTGALRNSIKLDGPTGTLSAGDITATLSAGAAHAEYVEKGTRPHEIRPRFRKALRWPTEGGFGFARLVRHPGTAPRPFLQTAAEEASKLLEEKFLPQAVELSFIEAGFDR